MKVYVCLFSDLPRKVDPQSLPNNGCGRENASYLVVEHHGKIVRVESSAMEPEDVSFFRDLDWVPQAISEAYNLGLKEAAK